MEFNLLIEKADGIAVLTITRPQALNALNRILLDELAAALQALDADAAVQAVVLTGAGEKAFVAGADIREMVQMTAFEAHQFGRTGQELVLAIGRMRKPVIAAVNGYALGGGLELALACDFIYAAETAKLGFPEVTLGILPGFGGTQNLARRIGRARANELIFTGRMIDAAQAQAWGIVNAVLPPLELLPRTLETAKTIANAASLGVRYAKDAVRSGLDMTLDDGFRYEAALFGVLFSTEDQKEGMRAFLEKRRAVFQGK